ncbi:hypothetical protein [Abditibacterium utsteinense]|uniref:hypothetical protein n=1 Tax=Abditibacterium utsteinense TaxID=1960156 RepID=UPI000F4AA134|nr:hypothetical protein [Abditibacterium utsteinense]
MACDYKSLGMSISRIRWAENQNLSGNRLVDKAHFAPRRLDNLVCLATYRCASASGIICARFYNDERG